MSLQQMTAFGPQTLRATVLMSGMQPVTPARRLTAAVGWISFAIVWFAALGARSLIAPDEGRYATLSLAMLQSGDWITPRLNGLLYFEKPPFQYWAGAIAFELFGVNEFAARFWPGLSGFLTVVLVGYTGARLWGRAAGQIAALLAGSMLWIFGNGHFLTLDAGVTFFLTLALCGFLLAHSDGSSPRQRRAWMWLTWAAIAGAMLSKGLIGLLIPAATLVLYSLVTRQWLLWRRMYWLSGLALFLVLAVPWFVLVSSRNAGFARFFFIHEHFERFLTTAHHRAGPIWYFVPLLLIGLLPWAALLPNMLREGWRHAPTHFQPQKALLLWCAFTFVFFSLSGSKLPSYILPVFPALALLGGVHLAHARATLIARSVWVPIVIAAAALGALPFARTLAGNALPPEVLDPIVAASFAAALLLLGFCVTGLWFARRDRRLAAIGTIATGGLLAAVIATAALEPYGLAYKSSRDMVAALAPHIDDATPVFSVRDYDQTLPFYLGRAVTLVDYGDEFEFGERAEPDRWIRTVEEFVARWNAAPRAAASMKIAEWNELAAQGVPMREVYRNQRRVAVVKP